MPIPDPIVDRTFDDILKKTPKGYMNVVDWDRIQRSLNWVKVAVKQLLDEDVPFEDVADAAEYAGKVTRVVWVNNTITNMNRLLNYVCMPKEVFPYAFVNLVSDTGLENWSRTIARTTLNHYGAGIHAIAPNFRDVNAWEANIWALYISAIGMANYRVFCGSARTGQTRFMQTGFRTYQPPASEPFDPTQPAPTCGAVLGESQIFTDIGL